MFVLYAQKPDRETERQTAFTPALFRCDDGNIFLVLCLMVSRSRCPPDDTNEDPYGVFKSPVCRLYVNGCLEPAAFSVLMKHIRGRLMTVMHRSVSEGEARNKATGLTRSTGVSSPCPWLKNMYITLFYSFFKNIAYIS